MKRNFLFTRQVYLHVTLWIVVFISVFLSELGEKRNEMNITFVLLYMNGFLGFIITSYFHIFFLIPRFFKKKKYFLHFLILALTMVAVACLSVVVRSFFDESMIPDVRHRAPLPFLMHMLSGNIMLVMATSFIFFVSEWINFQDMTIRLKDAENEKTHAELNALKAQVNPHFLFNTLNNLYALALEKSDKAPEMILKLSDLMSYILYDCKAEKVLLKQELEFIINYIELEKQRFGNRLDIDLKYSSNIDNLYISPLIFIPFIENAFKHGAYTSSGKTKVDINFDIRENEVSFMIRNTKEAEVDGNTNKKHGVGIANVKKRLALVYPSKHEMQIIQEENWYQVNLKILLNGN